jgi:thymidylate kinase
MKIFISIDGIDGTGKTTVSKLLSKKLGFIYYKSPADNFEKLRSNVDKDINVFGRYSYYRLAVNYDSIRISELLKRNNVVSDRYILSTFAYHYAMNKKIKLIYDDKNIIKPNICFILHASFQVLEKRFIMRNNFDRIIENITLLKKVEKIFKNISNYLPNFNVKHINTDKLSENEVANKIIKILREYGY